MRKIIAILSLAALMLTGTAVFADDGEIKGEARVKAEEKLAPVVKDFVKSNRDHNRFVLNGTVNAVGSASITIDVTRKNHRRDVLPLIFPLPGPVVVAVDSDTKITLNDKTEIRLADIQVGNRVHVKGETKNGGLVANHIMVINKPEKVFGEVTAKTDTSVTVKNNVTNTEKTITVNPDTKVTINGETKTTADIQVGDKGVVKFKAMVDSLVASVIRLFR